MKQLKLYKLETQQLIDMPVNDVGPLIGKSLTAEILRKIILTKHLSKFFGFLSNSTSISKFLSKTTLSEKINKHVSDTYKQYNYENLNQAFIHRGERKLFPLETEISSKMQKLIISSPTDAYLNIRNIVDGNVELYPELNLDIKKMVGEKNATLFDEGGKFLLFTLKPFHDHTLDYPVCSQVINTPEILNKNNNIVLSTDLVFARFIADFQNKMIFNENHRVVTELKAEAFDEKYLFIEVGAINVNSIEQDNCGIGISYERGIQKSHFNFGSTVIILLPKSFSDKLVFPKIYQQDINTSVEVKRRNVIAWDKNLTVEKPFHIAKNVTVG